MKFAASHFIGSPDVRWRSKRTSRAMLAIVATCCTFTSIVTAQNVNNFTRPGGVAVLDIDTGSNVVPNVRFGRQPVAVVRSSGGWRAFVGLHPKLIPGDYVVTVNFDEKQISQAFRVAPPLSPSLLRNTPQDAPPPCADYKVETEWKDASLGASYLELPLPIIASELKPDVRKVASGVWLQTQFDTDIRSPGGGQILSVEPPGEATGTVIIDHGQGVASLLCPINIPRVTRGADITRGQVLGHIAGDGRLWWTLLLNGQRVNPLVLTRAAL